MLNYFSMYNDLNNNTANQNSERGIWITYSSSYCIVTYNTVCDNQHGIWLHRGSRGTTLTGNTVIGNQSAAIYLMVSDTTLTCNTMSQSAHGINHYGGTNNTITANTITNNINGITLRGSNNNTYTDNTIADNTYGIYFYYSSRDNITYNNNFLNNSIQALVVGGSGNIFDLPAPVGGNYWSDWIGPDNNHDGFVDSPYVFTGGQDNLPHVFPISTGGADETPPETTADVSGTSGDNGWYVSDVTVTLTATDEGGTGLCGGSTGGQVDYTEYSFDESSWIIYTGPFLISDEGSITLYYRSIDTAGNVEETKEQIIKIDKTPPVITGAETSWPNAGGWYNSDVTVHFDATDAVSGIASTTADVTVSSEGANQEVTGTSTDQAGNSASFIFSGIHIDKTAPTIVTSKQPAPNANGWNNEDVVVSFQCSDNLSGVVQCTPDTTVSTEGDGQYVAGSATDFAGNSASVIFSGIYIDKTAPTIVATRQPAPNANGWNNEDVVVSFQCSDSLSGIDESTPDTTVSTEGDGQYVAGSATDLAGNAASVTVSNINIDKTEPSITIVTPSPYGLYSIGVTLEFSASDMLSGVDSLVGSLTNTAGQTQEVSSGFEPEPGVYILTVQATDNAGNTTESEPVFFVVYDPAGGFATGGGWFYPDSESTLPGGKANFGFVAKYKRGSSTGNLEFQYKDADINLKSTTIDWLVISGVSAQFQGTGTINGQGLYTFRVMAKDNGEPGTGSDLFNIKIWENTDTEADPIHKAKNILSGGNIVIHKK
jgi:parallel beta-helix repeat protein